MEFVGNKKLEISIDTLATLRFRMKSKGGSHENRKRSITADRNQH